MRVFGGLSSIIWKLILMLVLSRRRKDRIVIDGNIEIFVLQLGPEEVKLGIQAPGEIAVHRGELYDEIAQENRAAAVTQPPTMELLTALRSKQKKS